jgi:hypothetical protein
LTFSAAKQATQLSLISLDMGAYYLAFILRSLLSSPRALHGARAPGEDFHSFFTFA